MIGIKLSKVRTFRLRKVCGFWKEEKREGKTQNRCIPESNHVSH